MVADCLDGDHEFGIVCHDGAGPAADIVQGKTGTIAHIDRVAGLPDGRSHVVVHLERLRQVKHLLTAVIAAIEARASTRERAHANGHGPMARG